MLHSIAMYNSKLSKMKKITILLALIIGLFFTARSNGAQLSAQSLADSIASIMKTKEIPGLFVSVVSKDSVLLQAGFGYADMETKEKVNERTLFRIGSISKTFTALAILKLIEEGKLSLETTLREIAPEIPFKNQWENSRPVRIKHLLEHKAGFDDMHFNILAGQREKGMSAQEEVLAMTNSLESRWEPGLVHSYSNPGYAVLGFIIEKTAKMPYQTYIQQEVLQKLGMDDTHFISEDDDYKHLHFSEGYSQEQTAVADVAIIGESAGSLLSSAADMRWFLQYFLNPQLQDSLSIIAPTLVSEMQQLHGWFEEENQITDGYGLAMYNKNYGSEDLSFKGHNGGIMGFVSDYIFSEELDLGIMISSNTEVSNRKVLNLLVDHFASGIKSDPIQTLSVPVSSAWDGQYRLVNERNEIFRVVNFPARTMTIKASGDSLMAQYIFGDPVYYHQVSEGVFIGSDDTAPSLFLATIDGVPVVYYDDQMMFATSSLGFFILRLLLAVAFMSGLVLLVSLVIRTIGSLFKVSWRKGLVLMLTSSLPVVCFVLSLILLLSKSTLTEMISLAEVSVSSVSILVMSILGPAALVFSIIIGIKNHWKGFQIWQKLFYGLVWLSTVFFVCYCFSFGWFAVSLWSY